ncbi:aminotransferase class V-fold PLP-dependent enzyme, partial [Arthrospira platensis SPKY1]|nr:aminotransferase class V-fold PLP-dependent enzyme [Arthrospira platensis SPKY1]
MDSAASSQMPLRVIERMNRYHRTEHANIHRGVHTLSQEATAAYEATRPKLQARIGAASENEIIFTSGATDALNLVAYAYAMPFLQAGDEILISEMEHHANIVPWQLAAQRTGAVIK